MKKIVFKLYVALSLLYSQTLPFVYTIHNKTNQEIGIAIRAPLEDKQAIPNFFNYACFDFPYLLEQLKNEQYRLPIIIFIPENYAHTSPLDDSAPLIEGSRVALAWASAYARFEKLGNLDIRIIPCTAETNIENRIDEVLKRDISKQSYATPEEKIQNSFFKPLDTSKNQTDITLISRLDTFEQKEILTIKPKFNSAKTVPRI